MIQIDDAEFAASLETDSARDVYQTLRDKMTILVQKLTIKYKDDLSVLFPVLNHFEDTCLDGDLFRYGINVPEAPPPSSSSSSSSSAAAAVTPSSNGVYLVDYSNNAIAVFGNTRIIKDALKKESGRFNQNLMDPITQLKTPGWIFPKTKKATVDELLKTLIVSYTGPTLLVLTDPLPVIDAVPTSLVATTDPLPVIDASDISINTTSELTIPSNVIDASIPPKIYYVNYSEKSIAVFGDAFSQAQHKDWFKEIGGKFNKYLSNPVTSKKECGWIFPLKSDENLLTKGISHLPVTLETAEDNDNNSKKRKIRDEDL